MFADKDQKIKVYSYDPEHKNYISSFDYFWAEGTGLAANSISIAPPDFQAGFTAVFNEVAQVWSVVEDQRGEIVYSTEDKTEQSIDYLGQIKTNFTKLKPEQFDTWNGSEWTDPRTEEEKLVYKRSQYPSLTRYQFLRCLLENGYKSDAIEAQILTIEDEFTRELTLLSFKEATNFVRTDESILAMQSILNLIEVQVDQMWEHALTL